MDFYFDENFSYRIANALNELEQVEKVHNVYSTEIKFGKGIKDIPLFGMLKTANGILITKDYKMRTRTDEFEALKSNGITAILISLPRQSFTLEYQTLISRWDEIKKLCEKEKRPFICRMTIRGKPSML